MNQISVVYATKTKHSQKLAEAIGQALHVKVENVKDSHIRRSADLLFLRLGHLNSAEVKQATDRARQISASVLGGKV